MLDTRGYACPIPVIMVQKEIQKNAPDCLTVLADNRTAVENITRFARSAGYRITVTPAGEDHSMTLEKE